MTPTGPTRSRPVAVVGIDAGGSGTRGVAVLSDGRVAATAERAASNPRTVGEDRSRQTLLATFAELRDRLDTPVVHVVVGMAGRLDAAPEPDNAAWAERLGVTRATIDSDARIAHAAAFGARPGVTVVAGTGSHALGFAPTGRRVRLGGWGPTFGDEGSAFWIAREAIAAALRDLDVGHATPWSRALLDFVGLHGEEAERDRNRVILDALYAPEARPADHARFALRVAALAQEGHGPSRTLLEGAGSALARLALRTAAEAGTREVSYAGSVLSENALVRAAFARELAGGDLRLTPPRWPPAFGAAFLALTAAGANAEELSRNWPTPAADAD